MLTAIMVNDLNHARMHDNHVSVTAASAMSEEPEARESLSYSYRPSVAGAPWEFRLTDTGIDWSAGRRSGHIPFVKLRRLRMAYRPVSMQSHRFVTEVWAEGMPKLTIISTTIKGLFEQQRRDKEYSAFIGELHRRLAAAGATPRCERGIHPFLYWPSLAVFAVVVLGLAYLVLRALFSDVKVGALFVAAFLGVFIWRGGNFLRRNRPGLYPPAAPPRELMPGG
jgi:hypothetical protein